MSTLTRTLYQAAADLRSAARRRPDHRADLLLDAARLDDSARRSLAPEARSALHAAAVVTQEGGRP